MAINPNLPELCFTLHPVTGLPVAIKRGQPGYFETDFNPAEGGPLHANMRRERGFTAQEWTDKMNATIRVTPAQVRAMEAGSMFGWHIPLADPAKFERCV